jgi:hypothetical protein
MFNNVIRAFPRRVTTNTVFVILCHRVGVLVPKSLRLTSYELWSIAKSVTTPSLDLHTERGSRLPLVIEVYTFVDMYTLKIYSDTIRITHRAMEPSVLGKLFSDKRFPLEILLQAGAYEGKRQESDKID